MLKCILNDNLNAILVFGCQNVDCVGRIYYVPMMCEDLIFFPFGGVEISSDYLSCEVIDYLLVMLRAFVAWLVAFVELCNNGCGSNKLTDCQNILRRGGVEIVCFFPLLTFPRG